MNKGFLTIAQSGQHDYVRMAYGLAMSLKISQSMYSNLTVVVNEGEELPDKYLDVFDNVIYMKKPEEPWKIQNKWKYYDITPYDETICLDCDMLFFHDILTWWECLEDKTLEFATYTVNYKSKVTTSDYYRRVYTINNLPNLHTALFYFKKTKENEEYFKLVRNIFENWEAYYERFFKTPPKFLSGDVSYSLAAKLFFNRKWNNEFLTFTHMRSRLQAEDIFENWHKELTTFFTDYFTKPQLKINNINQMYPFHYIKKDFLTDEVIELYENTLRLL